MHNTVHQRPAKELWQYASSTRRERESPEVAESNGLATYLYDLWEKLEFYVFLLVGSYSWYFIVFRVLDWHRFPFHLYTTELWLIVIVPIILILVMLYILDRVFTIAPTKED